MSSRPNRYDDTTQEDRDEEDARFEEWMEMSETEQNAELESNLRQLEDAFRHMTVEQHYARRRRSALRQCISFRNLYRQHQMEFMKKLLRDTQLRFLKLRTYRQTGVYSEDN